MGVNYMSIKKDDLVLLYDAWANGKEGYYKNKGEFRKAIVLKRYGIISEIMEKCFGRKSAIYPDLIDVVFEDGRVSHAHFTEGCTLL